MQPKPPTVAKPFWLKLKHTAKGSGPGELIKVFIILAQARYTCLCHYCALLIDRLWAPELDNTHTQKRTSEKRLQTEISIGIKLPDYQIAKNGFISIKQVGNHLIYKFLHHNRAKTAVIFFIYVLIRF